MLSNAVNALTLGLVASLAAPASAYIAFNCYGPVVEERADPIVNPGVVSGHVHKIAGGNGFGFTQNYAQARRSQCSSCPIKQDLSNYWTPKLYYHAQNGSFISVPVPGDGDSDLNGGMRIYYLNRYPDSTKKLTAFPAGFRMVAGNPYLRHYTGTPEAQRINFACYGGSGPETNALPTQKCPGGVRAQVFFPNCWDGQNLDSADHKSHMSYPRTDNGKCPDTHPVQMVSLFYEVLYDTPRFANQWYGNSQPFVFSQGDATGYGFHGDFLNGWDVPTLQRVIDECTDDSKGGSIGPYGSCNFLEQYTPTEQQACKIPPQVDEEVRGLLEQLPGCNSVTYGPNDAGPDVNCAATKISAAKTYYKDMTSEGWAYNGCATDSDKTRTLTGSTTMYSPDSGKNMTIEYCLNFCAGYTYAGLEYGSQCFCGNTVDSARLPQAGVLGNCLMHCSGDSTEYCGGGFALSLYRKCSGSDCSNAQYGSSKAKRHIHHPHARAGSL